MADDGGIALAVDDAVAEDDQSLVERDSRVRQVDLAARRATDADEIALQLVLRLQGLACRASRLGDEEQLQASALATSK